MHQFSFVALALAAITVTSAYVVPNSPAVATHSRYYADEVALLKKVEQDPKAKSVILKDPKNDNLEVRVAYGQKLGGGAQGAAYLAKNMATGKIMVAKESRINIKDGKYQRKNELEHLARSGDLLGTKDAESSYATMIGMEFVQGRRIADFVPENCVAWARNDNAGYRNLVYSFASKVFLPMIRRGTFHKDLNFENIIIAETINDVSGKIPVVARAIDFGYAYALSNVRKDLTTDMLKTVTRFLRDITQDDDDNICKKAKAFDGIMPGTESHKQLVLLFVKTVIDGTAAGTFRAPTGAELQRVSPGKSYVAAKGTLPVDLSAVPRPSLYSALYTAIPIGEKVATLPTSMTPSSDDGDNDDGDNDDGDNDDGDNDDGDNDDGDSDDGDSDDGDSDDGDSDDGDSDDESTASSS